MRAELYNIYARDTTIIKWGEIGGGCYLHEASNAVIDLVFIHKGFYGDWGREKQQRVMLKTYPVQRYGGKHPLERINSGQLFLANADMPDYALLYKLDIAHDGSSASFRLVEQPELGHRLITPEESQGVFTATAN